MRVAMDTDISIRVVFSTINRVNLDQSQHKLLAETSNLTLGCTFAELEDAIEKKFKATPLGRSGGEVQPISLVTWEEKGRKQGKVRALLSSAGSDACLSVG